MKISSMFFGMFLAITLNAGESIIEKYTELRNKSNIIKMQAHRDLVLKQRSNEQRLRDDIGTLREQRAAALYTRLERDVIPYR